jgi:hypothetical protein
MNNYTSWIGVVDIVPFFAVLSPNSPKEQVEQEVRTAQMLDLPVVFSAELIAALDTAIKANVQQYRSNKTYSDGDKVFYNNAYYIANDAIVAGDAPPSANWDNYELMNFFFNYVKPYLAALTMVRYMPYLGLHGTQWGIEQYNQEGFGQVSDKRRAELLNSIQGKCNAYENLMMVFANDENWTFDGVSYKVNTPCETRKKKLSFTVLGAGNRNKINYNDEFDRWGRRIY